MNYTLIPPRIEGPLSTVDRVLTNRGLELNDIPRYLEPTDDALLDPSIIANIDAGANMLLSHIEKNDNILVIVDCDCDGMTSSAILINYINCLYPEVAQTKIDYKLHSGKQHGLSDLDLEDACKKYQLVIAPDASSNDFDEHKFFKEHGVDVLVIDHHEADKVSENACIINNQLCDYPTKSLSGAGMVWKFCCYLDKLKGTDYAKDFLDLAMLGIVADMMDLRDMETRCIVKKGLDMIPRNPFYAKMAERQDFSIQKNDGLSPFTIGFYIAPYINAVTRVGTLEEKQIVFEAMLDFKGNELVDSTKRGSKSGDQETFAEQAVRLCINNIKKRQTAEVDKSLEVINTMIQEQNLQQNKILVVQLQKSFELDRNITGLIANKLVGEYKCPVLLLNERIDAEGHKTWEGSGRAPSDSDFEGLRSFLKSSNLVFLAEGHQNALGVGITDENLNEFIDSSNKRLENLDFSPLYKVDFIWDAKYFNPNDILKLASMNQIWGQEIQKPLVAIENIKVHSGDVQLLKETTLKITLPNGVTLIKFGSSQEEFDDLCGDPLAATTISVVGECKRNCWNGVVTPQIEVKAFEKTGEQKYYF